MTMVEQVDTEWYRGTCRGSTGFFPITYVQILVRAMNNDYKAALCLNVGVKNVSKNMILFTF